MSEHVGFAGQIGPEHVTQVVEKGFKSIINNRPDMEGGPEQRTTPQVKIQRVMQGWIMSISRWWLGKLPSWMSVPLPITLMNCQNRF